MNRNVLIKELKEAYQLASQYEGGYSGDFLDAKDFAKALNDAIAVFESGDDSCVKNLWLWFAPTTEWDNFVGLEGMDLGNSIFKKLDLYLKEQNIDYSITLYHLEREDIKIDIVARFDKGKLIIDGYDIGKTVEEAWGDSDYEYVMTIPARSLPPLYRLLNVKVDDRKTLLEALAKRFHGNKCFSAIGDFLDQNSIERETFTWT
jgi:hypothetical protein